MIEYNDRDYYVDNDLCDCCNWSDCCDCGEIDCTCCCDCECHKKG